VAATVADGDDHTPDAQVRGHRAGSLEGLAREAARRGLGLFLRLTDTLPIDGLAAALGAERSQSAATLRERVLVVVAAERVGKRLRKDAPQFPSAYELPATEGWSAARFVSANLRRASADADDLVIPWGRRGAADLAAKMAPELARRGGRLWISDVPEADRERAAALGPSGVVVRFASA
jgi:hypothetical protein